MRKIFTLLLSLSLVFVMAVPAFAYDFNGFGDIEPPDYDHETYPYAFFWRVTTLNDAYFYACSFKVEMEKQSVNNTLIPAGTGDYLYFTYDVDTKEWTSEKKTATENTLWITTSAGYVRWANYDIYRSDKGDVEANDGSLWLDGDETFMKAPLAEKIQKVAAVKLEELKTEMAGTMKILTVCGVGCLALVISSPLLVKVLRRFLA